MFNQQNIFKNQTIPSRTEASIFMNKVFGWMSAGLLVTALTANWTVNNIGTIPGSWYFLLFFGQLFLVYKLSRNIMSMSINTATGLFILYSALTGVSISGIAFVYTSASLTSTFLSTSIIFGLMAFYGMTTKTNLNSMGRFLIMGLFGIIISSIINIFIGSSIFQLAISAIGVLIFTGLTAYDTQKILQLYQGGDAYSESGQKKAVFGALTLYLDFINLFIFLLQFMGIKDE
ncbi:MAG: hypothetical protein CMF96_10325 [Candidatus Marinimicrobia bacterium]|nr:hypothetical protein [Candidatus Neomarinimicrobiota bacterium]|tara:strand:- start:17235 stop:17930 length:696 start_codon:yes stop_codon:yes gene_type:complete